MASSVRNICAKNRQNPSIFLKVTIDNVGVPFFETQCIYYYLYSEPRSNGAWCHITATFIA